MVTFLEDPMPAIFLGILAIAVLAALLPRTQRYGLIFLGMAGVLGLTVAAVVIERVVQTEEEQIEAVIDGLAAALEDNDIEGVVQYLAPTAYQTRLRAEFGLEQIHVTKAGVRNLEIAINRLTSPTTAEARFDGVLRFQFRGGELGRDFYAARFVVELRLEEDRWLVTDHIEHTVQSL